MINTEFDSLSEKFNQGKCTEEELIFLRKLANDNLKFQNHSNLESSIEVQNKIWDKLDLGKETGRNFRYYWIASGIAASMLLFFSLFFLWDFNNKLDLASVPTNGVETKNNANSLQKITLPDGSHVLLGKNANIIVAENFGVKSRTVYLTGEAFFTVTKNEKVPFFVHVDNLITEVIGTSFKISKPSSDKLIEVSVKTGKVSVYTHDEKSMNKSNGVIITPNQKAVFNLVSRTINESVIDVPLVILQNIKKSDFVFDDVSVNEIIKKMQQIYGIEIIQVNSNINRCVFTGDLNGLDMFKQLEFICSSINANFEVRGSSIFINGEGCK
jgi:ferric-dicitrate binding protein FerR (iron transport regulator)